MARMTAAPALEHIRSMSQWLQEHAQRWEVPETAVIRLDLCLNEAVANSLTHGGPGVQLVPLDLTLQYDENGDTSCVTLSVDDGGMPFDPTTSTLPPQARSLVDASPGGLGIRMLRSTADALRYQRLGEKNRLDIEVRWTL
jgi:anti-sigma regulatory factor (Ser/Thr protein kinase)